MHYEYLFAERKRIGSNIEAIMKDRKCTKVSLSQALHISRPTLDALLRGDINNPNKYEQYINRLLIYMQIQESILDNYKYLPETRRTNFREIEKEKVISAMEGKNISVITGNTEEALAEAHKLVENGVKVLAVSNRVNEAHKIIGEISEISEDIVIGMADVLGKKDASLAVDSGAAFIVTPYAVEEIVLFCKTRDIFCSLGAATVSEMLKAWEMGSDAVCLYPAEDISNDAIHAVKRVVPEIRFLVFGLNGKPQNRDFDCFGELYAV